MRSLILHLKIFEAKFLTENWQLTTDYCLKENAIKDQGFLSSPMAAPCWPSPWPGFPGAADNAAEARQLLAQGRADPGVGLVLITERVAREKPKPK